MADSVEGEIRDLRSLFWSERDPDGRVFVPLADAYRRSGDLDQAIEVLEDGLGRHADFGPAHVVAGWVRRARGETDLAERAFGAALDLDDENTEALRGLAELAAERGDLALAADCYRKLAELEPGDLEVRARLAEVESVAHAGDAHAAGFDAPALDTPAVEEHDPWAADPERILGTDDVVRTADELVFTADEIVLDVGEPAEASEAEVRIEPEPTAPAAPVEDEDDGPVTRTMADLYARQRLNDRALRLYRRLHERTPDDAGLADRVRELETLVAAEPAAADPLPLLAETAPAELAPEPEPLPMRAELERADEELVAEAPPAPPTVETGRSAPRPTARPERRPTDAEVETLARDWAEGPGHTGELSSPFAWAARPAEPSAAAAGRPIVEYFGALLSWEPGAEAIVESVQESALEAPMPASEPAQQSAVAEPIEPMDAEPWALAAAPEPWEPAADTDPTELAAAMPIVIVAIEALAPDAQAERVVVPIQSLAPDGEAAAVVSIESLAPYVVDVASLAPDAAERTDDFKLWLERLS